MLNQIRKYYFYLLLLNITFAANAWVILGLPIGQLLYWFILFLGVKVLLKTNYGRLGIFLFLTTFILKLSNSFFDIPYTGFISELSSGSILILVGASLYAENPIIVYRQLISFFVLSIPFMVLQKIGVSTFFYGWSTEVFHTNGTYSFDIERDLGVIFKDIPLFKTLFVEASDITSVVYQARPTGLLYSNNVLSVIISLALALHFSLIHNIKRNFKYFVISTIMVLTMSTLVYGVFVILFVYYYFLNKNKNLKSNALKTLRVSFVMLFFHYIFFPGLTEIYLGIVNVVSFVTRFAEIFTLLGVNYFDEYLFLLEISEDYIVNEDGSFSFIAELLKNRFSYVFIIFFILITIIYYKNLKKIQGSLNVYVMLFFVCILTQFAINLAIAPSFQLFLGIALFPIFRSKTHRLKKYNKRLSKDH